MNEQAAVDHFRSGPANAVVPLVDVLMLAYNVEQYIEQTVAGILAQRTDFSVRIVIAEDHSTDGTLEVCHRLVARHPEAILLIPGETNLGIAGRAAVGSTYCRAKYIAVCDSDDIWVDPSKLADQIAALEADHGCGLSYTDVHIIRKDGVLLERDGYDPVRADYAHGDVFLNLLRGNFINNSTSVFRREFFNGYEIDTDRDHFVFDYLLWLHICSTARVHFLDRRTTAYRQGGISSDLSRLASNEKKVRSAMGAVILARLRHRGGVDKADRPLIFRKVLGLLARPGTSLRIKIALLAAIPYFIPLGIGGWRDAFLCRAGHQNSSSAVNISHS